MTDRSTQLKSSAPTSETLDALPEVMLEFHQGAKRTAEFPVAHVDFLIGTVPGCDLRVSGTELPAVLCLLARRPGGLSLRKLAPTQVVLVNGKTAMQADLKDGDRITVGASDIFVHVAAGQADRETRRQGDKETKGNGASSNDSLSPCLPVSLSSSQSAQLQEQLARLKTEREAFEEEQGRRHAEIDQAERLLQERERKLQELTEAFDKDRATWLQRRQQTPDPALLPPDLRKREEQLSLREAEVQDQLADIKRQRQELANVRQELADIRKQLYDRYQERRDRLTGLQESVDRAARKVQERKRTIDVEAEEVETRGTKLEQQSQRLDDDRQRLEEERRTFHEGRDRETRELAERSADLQTREHRLAADRLELEGMVKHYQADVLRLDRLQGDLEERDRHLQARGQELEQAHARLKQDSEELELQAGELEDWRLRLSKENDELTRMRTEQTVLGETLAQRESALESQQAAAAALKTRLDRQSENLRTVETHLEEQRTRQTQAEADIERQVQESIRVRAELDSERKQQDQERQKISERQAILEAGENRLHQAEERLAQDEADLRSRTQEIEERHAQLTDQERVLRDNQTQLAQAQACLGADRQALDKRAEQLSQDQQACAKLREELDLRGEELAGRQQELEQSIQRHEADSAALKDRQQEWEQRHRETLAQLNAREKLLDEKSAVLSEQGRQLDEQQAELVQREDKQNRQFEQLREAGQNVADQRKSLAQERDKYQLEQQTIRQEQEQAQALFIEMRLQAQSFVEQLADIELSSGTALEQIAQAREQLRDHLNEINTYVRQCQEESEKDTRRLETAEQALRQHQDELRLAVVSIREQARELDQQRARLLEREESERKQVEQLNEAGKVIAAQRQQLSQEREQSQHEQQEFRQEQQQAQTVFIEMRLQTQSFLEQFPDVELRAGTTLDRLAHARDQLRDHLSEISNYVRQCQEETGKNARALQEAETTLRQHQDEHRLALVSFRQQLLDWQSQVADTKRLTARGQKTEDRGQKTEDRGQKTAPPVSGNEADDGDAPLIPIRRDILSLTDPADPSEQQLSDLLRRANLVDANSLQALVVESRRQRRPLRQVLVAGGTLTPYQLALVEAGNADALLLGPWRVIDRIRATPRENVYHVFDPRRNQETLARHLSEEQAKVPGRSDEFRQSFTRTRLDHPHLAQTLEILDIANRPAVLQEWLNGLPSSDWPALVAVPGVCYRLLIQTAQALEAIHAAGFVHGHLRDSSILLTHAGIVKVCGLGEPAWLIEGPFDKAPSAAGDLHALGKVASSWCTPIGVRRGARTKPPPDALVTLVLRLASDGKSAYASASQLLADLERLRGDVSENPEAWERLLKHVRDHAAPVPPLRRCA